MVDKPYRKVRVFAMHDLQYKEGIHSEYIYNTVDRRWSIFYSLDA